MGEPDDLLEEQALFLTAVDAGDEEAVDLDDIRTAFR